MNNNDTPEAQPRQSSRVPGILAELEKHIAIEKQCTQAHDHYVVCILAGDPIFMGFVDLSRALKDVRLCLEDQLREERQREKENLTKS